MEKVLLERNGGSMTQTEKQLKADEMMKSMERNTFHVKVNNKYISNGLKLTDNYNFAYCFESDIIDSMSMIIKKRYPDSKITVLDMFTAKRKEQMKGSVKV